MRIDYMSVFPPARTAMLGLEKAVHSSSLDPLLLELIKIRASQINGCAHCLEMHTKDARALGETDDRMHLIAAWRETPVFTPQERAALAWCESLTLVAQTGAPDADFAGVLEHFSDEEAVALTLAIVAINSWNRFAIGMRAESGHYVSPHSAAHAGASQTI